MAFVSFEQVLPLIDSTEQVEGRLRVYFKCPKSGRVVESTGSFPDSARRNFAQVATGSTLRALLHQLSALIRRYTGIYIPLGNAVQGRTVPGGSGFVTESDRREAAVAAFQTVAEYPGKPKRSGRFNLVDGEWVFVE